MLVVAARPTTIKSAHPVSRAANPPAGCIRNLGI
jgi:hypothetical protein